MKQVLSFEQMKHLKDLGVNTSDASMVLIATDDDGCTLLWEDAEKQLNTICTMSISIYIMLKAVVMIIPLKRVWSFYLAGYSR